MDMDRKQRNLLLACCGLDCEACDARIATIRNDGALREKTAALWTKLNGTTITAEMIHCTGCRAEGVKTPFCDRLCPIHNCVREKGLDTCADCPQMSGCPTLERITANNPSALERLERLRASKQTENAEDMHGGVPCAVRRTRRGCVSAAAPPNWEGPAPKRTDDP